MPPRRHSGGERGGNSMGNTEGEFQNMLRGYDAAAAQDARTQYMQGKQQLEGEKFDFQRQKEGILEAQRQAGLEQRATQADARSERAQQSLDSLKELRQVQEERAQLDQQLKIKADTEKEKATISRQQAALKFWDGYAGLNPHSEEFPKQLSSLMKDVESQLVDKEGNLPTRINEVISHAVTQNGAWQQHNIDAAEKASPQNPTDAMADALASSSHIYGYVPTGKSNTPDNFVATQAGAAGSAGSDAKDGAPQPHVQATYVDPGTRKLMTKVFDRSAFDGMVSASQARTAQGSATGSEPDGLTPTQLQSGNAQATASAPTVVAPPAVAADSPSGQHPFEGQRKFQMSTGKWGTITNGQFVPE